jgi:hypothetical protein
MTYQLTEKTNFVETDEQALRQLCIVQGIIIDFFTPFVHSANSNEDAINLWEVAKGMHTAVEVYLESKT